MWFLTAKMYKLDLQLLLVEVSRAFLIKEVMEKWRLKPVVAFYFYDKPLDTGRKLKVHETLRKRLGRLLNVLCTFNLRLVSRENDHIIPDTKDKNRRFGVRGANLIGQIWTASQLNAFRWNSRKSTSWMKNSFWEYLRYISSFNLDFWLMIGIEFLKGFH